MQFAEFNEAICKHYLAIVCLHSMYFDLVSLLVILVNLAKMAEAIVSQCVV